LIECVWKEKVKAAKIKETIQAAFNEIYRGNFEEIKELDEEQMYNSWMNSRCNTERFKTDSHGTSVKKRLPEEKCDGRVISGFDECTTEEPQMLVSDIYDKSGVKKSLTVIEREEHNPNIPRIETQHLLTPNADAKSAGKIQQQKQRIKTAKSGSEHLDNFKLMQLAQEHNAFARKQHKVRDNKDLRVHEDEDISDGGSSVEGDMLKYSQAQPTQYFRGITRRHMRSFDRNNHFASMNNKTFSYTNEDTRAPAIKHSGGGKDGKKPNACLKEQYYTNFNNRLKRDSKYTSGKIESLDAKLKQSIKHTTRDYNLRMSLNKMHYRNRSANSIKCKSQNEETVLAGTEQGSTSRKKTNESRTEFTHAKTDLYR